MTLRCDSHIHVVEDPAVFPMVATRTYTAPPAPLAALEHAAKPSGIRRFVVVQPSFYGADNSLLVKTLHQLGPRGRAVAVIDPAHTSDADLSALHQAGVRGLRVNFYSTLSRQSAVPIEAAFTAAADTAARMGWHVELLAELPILLAHAALLTASPAPVVIDHYALYGSHTPHSPEGQALLALLRHGHIWLKLSAPYRVGDDLATRPDPAWMAAFLDAAAPRCVWGSDWPHTPPHQTQTGGGVPLPYRELDYTDVVEGFRAAVGDHALAETIMTANAARLYGFE